MYERLWFKQYGKRKLHHIYKHANDSTPESTTQHLLKRIHSDDNNAIFSTIPAYSGVAFHSA